MKRFLSTFLAILCAAAIIIPCLRAQARLDAWRDKYEKAMTAMEVATAMLDNVEARSQGSNLVADLHARDAAAGDCTVALSNLETILRHKPFFPLNEDERRCLTDTEKREHELAAAQPKAP